MDKRPVISVTGKGLAEQIRKRRGDMGKQKFADAIGATRMMVYLWERGDYAPSTNYLEKLGLEPCFRVVDDSPMSPDTPAEPVSRASRGLGAADAKTYAKKKGKRKPAE